MSVGRNRKLWATHPATAETTGEANGDVFISNSDRGQSNLSRGEPCAQWSLYSLVGALLRPSTLRSAWHTTIRARRPGETRAFYVEPTDLYFYFGTRLASRGTSR